MKDNKKKILELFFQFPLKGFYLREISREVKIAVTSVKKYLVVIGQKKLPVKIFKDTHNVKRKNIYTGDRYFKAIPRIGKKAYPSKKESISGAYAALIEII